MRTHAGQVAFPGGRIDPGEDGVAAALREAMRSWPRPATSGHRRRRPLSHGHRLRRHPGGRRGAARPALVPTRYEVAACSKCRSAFCSTPPTTAPGDRLFSGPRTALLRDLWGGRRIWGATAAMIVNLSRRLEWRMTLSPPIGGPRRARRAGRRARARRGLRASSAARCATTCSGSRSATSTSPRAHPPDAVLELLKAAGINAVPTGIDHGTITAVLDGGPVEITTLRRDVSTDGRRATVAFTDDWREDAARRDFTINALYADPGRGEIVRLFRRACRSRGAPRPLHRRPAEAHRRGPSAHPALLPIPRPLRRGGPTRQGSRPAPIAPTI